MALYNSPGKNHENILTQVTVHQTPKTHLPLQQIYKSESRRY